MKNSLIFMLMITGVACSSLSFKPNSFLEDNQVAQIKIGSTSNLVQQELGQPSRKNVEIISGAKYTVWEFGSEDKPIGFITFDPKNNRVISKSIWIYNENNEVEVFLKRHFKDNKFKTYIPCELSGKQTVLIDPQNGVLLATKEQSVVLVSWSESKFAALRAKQFELKCPQLQ